MCTRKINYDTQFWEKSKDALKLFRYLFIDKTLYP